MLRLALCVLLGATTAAALNAQATGYTPPASAGTGFSNGGAGWSTNAYLGPWSAWRQPTYYRARQATPAQIRIGAPVHSVEGGLIGRIAYVNGQVAVVKSAHWAMRMPLKAFGAQDDDLLLKVSPAGFDNLAKLHGARTG